MTAGNSVDLRAMPRIHITRLTKTHPDAIQRPWSMRLNGAPALAFWPGHVGGRKLSSHFPVPSDCNCDPTATDTAGYTDGGIVRLDKTIAFLCPIPPKTSLCDATTLNGLKNGRTVRWPLKSRVPHQGRVRRSRNQHRPTEDVQHAFCLRA